MRPRLQSGACARPLNFTVRRHVLLGRLATLPNHDALRHRRTRRGACGRGPQRLGEVSSGNTLTRWAVGVRISFVWASRPRPVRNASVFSVSALWKAVFPNLLVDNTPGRAQLRALWPEALP